MYATAAWAHDIQGRRRGVDASQPVTPSVQAKAHALAVLMCVGAVCCGSVSCRLHAALSQMQPLQAAASESGALKQRLQESSAAAAALAAAQLELKAALCEAHAGLAAATERCRMLEGMQNRHNARAQVHAAQGPLSPHALPHALPMTPSVPQCVVISWCPAQDKVQHTQAPVLFVPPGLPACDSHASCHCVPDNRPLQAAMTRKTAWHLHWHSSWRPLRRSCAICRLSWLQQS
jgi:hypothetical protein